MKRRWPKMEKQPATSARLVCFVAEVRRNCANTWEDFISWLMPHAASRRRGSTGRTSIYQGSGKPPKAKAANNDTVNANACR
jgi:hypothetical protein